MKYVIIGNSAAAVGCVEGIRSIDRKGEIVIISNEPHHTYSRPLISYLIYGKTDERRMRYRDENFYSDNNCKTLFGRTAVTVDAKNKCVTLEDGESVAYDRLLIATGSSPFVPPIGGLDRAARKFTFMSLSDAQALDAAVGTGTRVLILGAGLIGLKCAEGLHKKNAELTVVDMAPYVLSSILDRESADMMQKHIEGHGVRFILSDSVKAFTENEAELASGNRIPFDVLVLAVGVRSNTDLAAKAGAKVNRGIVTDTGARTTLKDVYAAGDCAESYDVSLGECRVLALWPNAYMQGECAGINMAGGSSTHDRSLAMNAIGFFGKHIITAGCYDGEEYKSVSEGSYKKLVFADNRLKGYIMLGDIARAGIYTSMIRERIPLDTLDFELIKEKPALMAFSKIERSKKLGGAKI